MRVPGLLILLAAGLDCAAATIASGRNWQVSIRSLECDVAESRITLGMAVRYLGPKGVVEAPVSQIVDANRKAYSPKGLVWKSGSKALAAWLSAGGMRQVQEEHAGELQLRFHVVDAAGELKLEFGDIAAFPLTHGEKALCARVLRPAQIKSPRKSRPAAEVSQTATRIYRGAYPCLPQRTVEAEFPPYLPEQLLVFGRGYLPSLRQVDLPMGKAPAQAYLYAGSDDPKAVESFAQRALAADFAEFRNPKFFAFNWGIQKTAAANELFSIGIYALRPCS